jgi:hypothetical protein
MKSQLIEANGELVILRGSLEAANQSIVRIFHINKKTCTQVVVQWNFWNNFFFFFQSVLTIQLTEKEEEFKTKFTEKEDEFKTKLNDLDNQKYEVSIKYR